LRRYRQTRIEGAEVTWFGKLFHTDRGSRKGSSTVDSRVLPTISDEDEVERSH